MSYLGIDLGGSKTLLGVFDDSGNLINQKKIETNKNYDIFISDVEKIVAEISTNTKFTACAVAIPGLISREEGLLVALGNLDWQNKSIKDDVSRAIGGDVPVIIENDSRVAGLAETVALSDRYKNVFYVTISTGIGCALIENGRIPEALQDMESGHMPIFYESKIQKWEDFASGHAIVERYGKQASEIDDEKTWQEIGERIGYGLAVCCTILQPEAIVFGGGAGQFADKFKSSVNNYLEAHLSSIIKKPKELLAPAYGPDSAIHGCFVLLKQKGLVK